MPSTNTKFTDRDHEAHVKLLAQLMCGYSNFMSLGFPLSGDEIQRAFMPEADRNAIAHLASKGYDFTFATHGDIDTSAWDANTRIAVNTNVPLQKSSCAYWEFRIDLANKTPMGDPTLGSVTDLSTDQQRELRAWFDRAHKARRMTAAIMACFVNKQAMAEVFPTAAHMRERAPALWNFIKHERNYPQPHIGRASAYKFKDPSELLIKSVELLEYLMVACDMNAVKRSSRDVPPLAATSWEAVGVVAVWKKPKTA